MVNDKSEPLLIKVNPSLRWRDRFLLVRNRLELDQDEMGRKLGVSREWVSKLENGKEEPSKDMQEKLVKLEIELGLHISEPSVHTGKTRSQPAGTERGISPSSGKYDLSEPHGGAVVGKMPNRKDCEDLLRAILDAAERKGDPADIPYLYKLLKKHVLPDFPIDE